MTKQAARIWVDNTMPELMNLYGGAVSNPTYAWRDDEMEFSGRVQIVHIKGTLGVTETELILDVDGIPFFLKGKARAAAERWLDENLPT